VDASAVATIHGWKGGGILRVPYVAWHRGEARFSHRCIIVVKIGSKKVRRRIDFS